MKVYVVCEVNKNTGEISRVREVLSSRKGAINRAIALLQDKGSFVHTEFDKDVMRIVIEEYLNTFGEFYGGFEVAVFERTVDPFS